MRGRVVERPRAVMGHRQHDAVADHDCTDRHLSDLGGRARRREGAVERPRRFVLRLLDRIGRHGVYHPIAGTGTDRRRDQAQVNVNAWNIPFIVTVAITIAASPREIGRKETP